MNYEKLLKLQKNTLEQVVRNLKLYRFCNMVRPVGFGKTYLLSKLVEKYNWSDVVYFYPITVVKLQSLKDMCSKKITYISYNKLARLSESNELYSFRKGTLFIFDESTFVCGSKTFTAYTKLSEYYKDTCYFVGSSANQLRKDGIDVTEKAFKGIGVSYYDLNMGIKEGIYSKINYFLCNFELDSILEGAENKLSLQGFWSSMSTPSKVKYTKYLKNKILKSSNLVGASAIYRKGILQCISEEHQRYMRFLVYFYSQDALDKQCKKIKEDFTNAFPNKNINIIKVSDNRAVSSLYELDVIPDTIDLILSTGSVQFGYHDNMLTGVILFRSTDSEVVFSQSALRGMSVANPHGTIIFDMVGNSYKASERYFKGESIPRIRIPNSGGNGYIDPYNIHFYSTEQDVSSIFNNVELDRIKKAIKLEKLINNGIVPIDVACKELGILSEKGYYSFMDSIKEAKSLLA